VKKTFYIFILAFGLLSCNSKTEKTVDNSNIPKTSDNKIKLHKLEKLFVVGDFISSGKRDTIFQHNYSRLTKSEIENSADPFQNDWDTVVKWFYNQDSDLYLTINKDNQDTLHLGIAQGLYCLINIGDNNADGKDEIAFVADRLDDSKVNSCKIYSLCNGKWTLLKQFDIHEDSFDFTPGSSPTFDNIKNFLEKKNGKWVYKDYSQDEFDKQEDVGKMQTLKLDKCK
jgi:hypothetical protein